ncbi:MAG: ROK family protein [Gammaproteobacteria bacterium]|nr:MAG: ROK family protein [Gammaproteobacteria bacterium]
MAAALLGIDLGGTKIEGLLLSPQGEALARQRVATPAGDYALTLSTIHRLVMELQAQAGVDVPAIGIGTPGALSRVTGRMKNCNSVCLNGEALPQDLQALLGKRVLLANDADCFTLSEAVDGAGAGASTVFGVILGTGVGGGVAVNGQLLSGPNAITGEWGHNPLSHASWSLLQSHGLESRRCYCGRMDCIEAWLSGPALARTCRELGYAAADAAAVAAAAATGQGIAQQALALHHQLLAHALAVVINILDPDVIVLGGGVSNIDALYASVPELWHGPVFSDRIDTRLVKARYGDASGVRGAAWLCRDVS